MSRQLCKTAPLVLRFSPRADLTDWLTDWLADWVTDCMSKCATDRPLLEFMRHVARTMQPAACVCACWRCCHSGWAVNYLCQLDIYLARRLSKPWALSPELRALSFALHIFRAWTLFRAYFPAHFVLIALVFNFQQISLLKCVQLNLVELSFHGCNDFLENLVGLK